MSFSRPYRLLLALLAAVFASPVSHAQPPIAWFSFDAPGDPGADAVGGHDAISVVGVGQVPGLVGQGGSFINGSMQLPEAADLNLLGGDFTLSVLVNSADLSNRNWFTKANPIEHRYGLGHDLAGHVGLQFNGNALFGLAQSRSVVFDGEWHHVAGIKRGLTAEMWVDGVLEATDPINSGFGDDGAFAIGRDGQCCEHFNGLMDEAKIWSRALTPVEIATEANLGSFCQASGAAPLYAVGLAATGVNPSGTAIADFDEDGLGDLAVSNNASNSLFVYRGNGDGTFGAPDSYPLGSHSQQLAVGDFAEDGHLDLAVAISSGNVITLYRGDGTGAFALTGNAPTLSRPLSLAVADFDQDGHLDLATQSLDANVASVLWGDGTGAFGSRLDLAVGSFPNYIVTGDFDGDLLPDLAVTNRASDSVSVLLNLGGRQFGAAAHVAVADGPDSLAAADLDGDGDLDLAVACNLADEIALLWGDGGGAFSWGSSLTGVESGPHIIAAADVNLDALVDLLFNHNDKNLTIDFRQITLLPGDGAGGFGPGVTYPVGKQPNYLSLGELNADGRPDLAVANLNSDDATVLVSAPPCLIEVVADRDSFLRQGAPDTNEGANEVLRIQRTGNNRALVAFDLAGVSLAGLVRATLNLTIAGNADNWGSSGRTVAAHRLLAPWTEGNGWSAGGDGRGEGPGVTWPCATDADISDQQPDCDGSDWDGGLFAAATGPGVLHTNGLSGEVSWDVTADVLAGAPYGWILVKDLENQNGRVFYHSREGAASLGNPALTPRLVLEYR
jgi:hypothetical protein